MASPDWKFYAAGALALAATVLALVMLWSVVRV
jgi:hypothetical protein